MFEIIQQLKKEYIDFNLDEIFKEVELDEVELFVILSKFRFFNKIRGYFDKLFVRKVGCIRDEI